MLERIRTCRDDDRDSRLLMLELDAPTRTRAAPHAGNVAVTAAATRWRVPAQPRPDVGHAARTAARYVAEYEQAFSAVVSEERYSISTGGGVVPTATQVRRARHQRRHAGWMGFRDVFQVDGRATRSRGPAAEARHAAGQRLTRAGEAMADESARSTSVDRPHDQHADARAPVPAEGHAGSIDVHARRHEEDRRPSTSSCASPSTPCRASSRRATRPAGGRFWLEPDSGRVIRSELVVDSGNARATITVTYGERPKLAVWVPTSMDEAYMWPSKLTAGNVNIGSGSIECHASYTNFRSFNVDVSTIVK
jgi:hypothetical protein